MMGRRRNQAFARRCNRRIWTVRRSRAERESRETSLSMTTKVSVGGYQMPRDCSETWGDSEAAKDHDFQTILNFPALRCLTIRCHISAFFYSLGAQILRRLALSSELSI